MGDGVRGGVGGEGVHPLELGVEEGREGNVEGRQVVQERLPEVEEVAVEDGQQTVPDRG